MTPRRGLLAAAMAASLPACSTEDLPAPPVGAVTTGNGATEDTQTEDVEPIDLSHVPGRYRLSDVPWPWSAYLWFRSDGTGDLEVYRDCDRDNTRVDHPIAWRLDGDREIVASLPALPEVLPSSELRIVFGTCTPFDGTYAGSEQVIEVWRDPSCWRPSDMHVDVCVQYICESEIGDPFLVPCPPE